MRGSANNIELQGNTRNSTTIMERFKPGQIVYCQGIWKCRVVEDRGDVIDYLPLQGFVHPEQKGRMFTAAARLFKRELLYGRPPRNKQKL